MSSLWNPLRFGVHTPTQHTPMNDLRTVWKRADELGFDWISVWDHLQPVDGRGPSFDAVSCHAALAATTRSARVGCLVYSAGYHHAATLALAATTIDHLSTGRCVMGLGAGYLQHEYERFGFRFEPASTRVRRLEAFADVMRALLDGEAVTRADEFVELDDASIDRRPVQDRLPIWIGGGGEHMTLPLAGRVADGWNIPMATPEDFARKNTIVSTAAVDADRDPSSIERSVNVGLCFHERDLPERFGPRHAQLRPAILTGSNDRIVDHLASYSEAGADTIILSLRAPLRVDEIERFAAEILPQLRSRRR